MGVENGEGAEDGVGDGGGEDEGEDNCGHLSSDTFNIHGATTVFESYTVSILLNSSISVLRIITINRIQELVI